MKRKSNVSDKAQKKISRGNDRAMGRAGMIAANQKSASAKQHGDPLQHERDVIHLNMNKRPSQK